MTSWLKAMFGTGKPIIAMVHLPPLAGDPDYESLRGMQPVVARARADLLALQEGGVDAVMFSNEASLPYLTRVEPVTLAAMARVVGEVLADIHVPFGVNVLWDPMASIDLAAAVGAAFVREVFTGVYASDFGLWDTNCGAVIRHQHAIGAKDVRLLFNIVPEAAAYLAPRAVGEIARSTVFNARPDALCVSGLTAGVEAPGEILRQVKQAVPDTVVLANTGVRLSNVVDTLAVVDGAIVGTTLKRDGFIWNAVDPDRVREFMSVVRQIPGR